MTLAEQILKEAIDKCVESNIKLYNYNELKARAQEQVEAILAAFDTYGDKCFEAARKMKAVGVMYPQLVSKYPDYEAFKMEQTNNNA